MGLRLVDDDLDMSFDVPLPRDIRHAFGVQLQRLSTTTQKLRFEARLGRQMEELIDADLRPPSERQVTFAVSIAKLLGVSLPGDALRHRGSMSSFIERYESAYRDRVVRQNVGPEDSDEL